MQLLQYYSTNERNNSDIPAQILTEDQAFREYMDGNLRATRLARQIADAKAKLKPKQKKPKQKKSEPQRRAKATPQTKWLKKHICPLVYDEKTPDGIFPSVKKEEFLCRWNTKRGLRSLPNYKLNDHFQGTKTLYFMGQGWIKADRTLGMIDIDVLKCKRLGTPEGARKFAEHLKTIWPDLYFETSTNGKGIHGYFILWKHRCDAKRTNAALKRLEKWLRAEAKKVNADIEQVEIKGTCLDLTLDDKFAQAVKFGVPAKLPRDISRFAEWEQTTVLRVHDLEGSVYDVNEPVMAADAEDVVVETEPVIEQLPDATPVKKAKTTIVAGSVSNKFINEEALAGIPTFERMYREWVGPNDLMAGKFRVTAHDFAVAMVLLRRFKSDGNFDKSLPCRRVAELWTGLYQAGDIERGWNHHRWRVIRDFLSARGHIDWTDHRYELPTENGKNDQKKSSRGIACKWAITGEYDHWLNRVAATKTLQTGEASFVDTYFKTLVPRNGKGENLRPISCCLRALKLMQRFDEACDLLFAA